MHFAGFLSGGSRESARDPKQTTHALPVPYSAVHCPDRYVLSINLPPSGLGLGGIGEYYCTVFVSALNSALP